MKRNLMKMLSKSCLFHSILEETIMEVVTK